MGVCRHGGDGRSGVDGTLEAVTSFVYLEAGELHGASDKPDCLE